MNIKEASGIELLRAMKEGKISYSSIADTVPMRFTELEIGSVKCVIKADNRHINPPGGVHGGFAATVLDSVTGCYINTMLEAGVGYGTVDLNIKMMRPIPLNEELQAEGRELNPFFPKERELTGIFIWQKKTGISRSFFNPILF